MKPKSNIIYHRLKMEIPSRHGTFFYPYGEVMYICCDKPYCMIHCTDGKKHQVTATLKEISENLPQAFFRANQSVIISICHIKEYIYIGNILKMTDENAFPLSKRRIRPFMERKASLSRISPLCPSCYLCVKGCESRSALCRENIIKPSSTSH